ncbi:MAG: murein biosynthesis integral membrane protein MurJ [Anaerolineae bacterium]
MSSSTLSQRQIQLASLLIATSFIFSGVLGLVRQALINSAFGAGSELDAFLAAFRIPELLFTLVAGGALGAAFIPVFSRMLTEGDQERAWRLANAVMTMVALAGIVLSLLAFVFAQPLVSTILSPEASAEQQALIVQLMRIMLATVTIFGVSGLGMGILNGNQHFLAPALTPSMYNLGLIIGALLLVPSMGVFGLAWGAVLGAALHLAIQIPALRMIGFRVQPTLQWREAGAGEVLKLMAPRIVGQGVTQVNFLVNTALTSGMVAGSLTALMTSFTLMFTVLGVLGQSVGTAVFPTLSMLSAKNDMVGFRRTLADALRSVLFTTIPAAVGLILLAAPLIGTLFERNEWTPAATTAAAWALSFFAVGLPAFGLQEILARSFFALKDTVTPVLVAVIGVILNVILSLLLIRVVQGADPAQGPFGGLALANALATIIESAALWLLLRRRTESLHDMEVLQMVGRTLIAALIMAVAVIVVSGLLPESYLLRLAVGGIVGVAVFEIAGIVLRIPEARSVPVAILGRFRR